MKILITGARAPISADLAKVLALAGHEITLADSLLFPIGRFSPYVTRTIRLPAPARHFAPFNQALLEAVQHFGIDRIIPTSEEVFWLARSSCAALVFCPDFPMLERLHHKARFAEMVSHLGCGTAFNQVLSCFEDSRAIPDSALQAGLIVKPVFSRFGLDVQFNITRNDLERLDFRRQWLVQTQVKGQEYCVYAVAHHGEVFWQSVYIPCCRIGQGASLYFEPANDPHIDEFLQRFVAHYQLTGQLSFDVILGQDGHLTALECNPRGTSGIHLAAQSPDSFSAALLGLHHGHVLSPHPRYLALPFWIYHTALYAQNRAVRQDIARAHDALSCSEIPLMGAGLALTELLGRALFAWADPTAASTQDFEWNGTDD